MRSFPMRKNCFWLAGVVNNHGSIYYLRPRGNVPQVNGMFLSELGLVEFEVDEGIVQIPWDSTNKPCYTFEPGRAQSVFTNFVRPFINIEEEIIATGDAGLVLRYTLHSRAHDAKNVRLRLRGLTDRAAESAETMGDTWKLCFDLPDKGGGGLGVADFTVLRAWHIPGEKQPLNVQFPDAGLRPYQLLREDPDGRNVLQQGVELDLERTIEAGGSTQVEILVSYDMREQMPAKPKNQAREDWEAFRATVPEPELHDANERLLFDHCWQVLCFNEVKTQTYHWCLTSFGHPTVFVWDTSPFIVNAYLRKDPGFAQAMTVAQLESIKTSGMMPLHVIEGFTRPEESADEITQMPLVADSVWAIFQKTEDLEYAKFAYTKLKPNYAWYEKKRKPHADVPLWGIDDRRAPYFYGPEAGLDNAAIYDDGPKYSVGINGAKFSFERAMEGLADKLGLKEEARQWGERKQRTQDFMVERMWDEADGFMYALDYDLNYKKLKSGDIFAGLYVGVLLDEQVRRVAEVFEAEFMTDYGLTSCSKLDPTYDPDNMARGSVWSFMNYAVFHGLKRAGVDALANRIAEGTMRMLAEFPGAYESVNPETHFLARTKVGPYCYPRMSFSAAGMLNIFYER